MIELGYESIHACVNDCFLFWGDANKDVHFCLVCNTSRWKDSDTPGKNVSKKVLRYFLIILRLQHLYKSSHTAKEMTWQHPVDGRAWKDFDTKYPDFAAEPRNVLLGLAVDEPKSPGKDIDVYLRSLIDDLKDLWAKPGVETIDVFKSLCKSISLRPVIRIDHQELKKVIWYVLHNSPEIDTYRAKFKSELLNKDMKEEFPGWFGKQIRQSHVYNDLGVSESSELFALACGLSQTLVSVNSYVVNGVRFVVHSRDERRITQNNDICSPGPDGEMYYGQLEQILEFSYLSFKTVLFRVKWFDTSNKGRIQKFFIRNNITQIKANGEAFKNDQYILATQVKQCFYLKDMARRPLGWKVIEHVSHKKFLNGGVIVVEDDPDVIHVKNSSNLALSTSLNDLEITALHIDDQSIDVDAPPDIIYVVDEDDYIIDEEDPIPHDLADSDDEDLVNLDIDDGVNAVSSSEEED
ncbi:RNA-directed DNA polymerase, eukaryota [Tanacetum coccineum]